MNYCGGISYLFWLADTAAISVTELTSMTLTPGVKLSIGSDGCAVATPACYVPNMFSLKSFDHLGSIVAPIHIHKCTMCMYIILFSMASMLYFSYISISQNHRWRICIYDVCAYTCTCTKQLLRNTKLVCHHNVHA